MVKFRILQNDQNVPIEKQLFLNTKQPWLSFLSTQSAQVNTATECHQDVEPVLVRSF